MPNWPPAWSTLAIRSKPGPRGEVGTLEEVLMNNLYDDRIFMAILYEGHRYLGCLIFDDASFCFQIFAFLKLNRGKQKSKTSAIVISLIRCNHQILSHFSLAVAVCRGGFVAGFAVMAFRLIIAAVEQVGYCFVRHGRSATAAGERPSIARLPGRDHPSVTI